MHRGTGIENSLHDSTSSHLLQVISRPHPNPTGILQNHPNPTISNLVNPTSVGLEVRNSPRDQSLQSNPNEDSHLEL